MNWAPLVLFVGGCAAAPTGARTAAQAKANPVARSDEPKPAAGASIVDVPPPTRAGVTTEQRGRALQIAHCFDTRQRRRGRHVVVHSGDPEREGPLVTDVAPPGLEWLADLERTPAESSLARIEIATSAPKLRVTLRSRSRGRYVELRVEQQAPGAPLEIAARFLVPRGGRFESLELELGGEDPFAPLRRTDTFFERVASQNLPGTAVSDHQYEFLDALRAIYELDEPECELGLPAPTRPLGTEQSVLR